ncbi:MAG: hypothetical protein H7263_04315 [Candidatus Sericytochromatia bacterium]|nr:hypothetical protein [Candidatus Sericytochromatia bacterium]
MKKNHNSIFKFSIAIAISLACINACGGRLPPAVVKPSAPVVAPTNSPAPSGTPTVAPSGTPPVNPTPIPNPTPSITPPDPGQPKTEDQFWDLMTRFGFTRTKEDITNDIKKQIATKITDWSKGQVGDKDKNIEAHFKGELKYFKVPSKDPKEYFTRSMALAAKADGIDYYLDISYGPKGGTINLEKVDAKSLEILFLNKDDLISNYTQTNGSLLRLSHFMLIPSTIYGGKSTLFGDQASASSFSHW